MIVASVDIITPQKFIINGLLILAYLKHKKRLSRHLWVKLGVKISH
ncbi:hypothetical protein EJK54_0500 [Moraxella catarrhalis]|uniref:Uncharacterized protein n=1 Tax=Moraxella catarrhalis TaxID=480 RepID=A0ABY0BH26_MORCA|nr:hypothetical protein EJK54_0500 [Moraxella catarrhalis]